MFFFKSKRSYNDLIDSYTIEITKIQNLLEKDDIDLVSHMDYNSTHFIFDSLKGKSTSPNNHFLSFLIPKCFKRTNRQRLRTDIIVLESEIAELRGFQEKSGKYKSLLGYLKSFYKASKSIFSKKTRSAEKSEQIERLHQLELEWRETLEKYQTSLSKRKKHLQKERSLYNLLVDKRKDLRRVVRNIINTSLDDDEDAYLINNSVFTHEKIRLNNNSFKNFKDAVKKYNYRCYSAYT